MALSPGSWLAHDVLVRVVAILFAVVLPGCFDLALPARTDGRVTGVASVVTLSGALQPVSGAVANVVGSSLSTATNDVGFFELTPIVTNRGQLVISYDPDGDGVADVQRAFDFETWGIGPNRTSSLGQVILVDSATVSGTVSLSGRPSGGQGGTTVFLLGHPNVAVTNDQGAFLLTGVPDGTSTLVATHDGFDSKRVSLTARSSELLNLAPLTLEPATSTSPAKVSGRVVLVPPADVTPTVAAVTNSTSVNLSVSAAGAFEGQVPPGRVTVVARASGHADGVVSNIVVGAGDTIDVGEIRLAPGAASFDAGQPRDAGPSVFGCGDGTVSGAEACDDGNTRPGDGCAADCTLETQPNVATGRSAPVKCAMTATSLRVTAVTRRANSRTSPTAARVARCHASDAGAPGGRLAGSDLQSTGGDTNSRPRVALCSRGYERRDLPFDALPKREARVDDAGRCVRHLAPHAGPVPHHRTRVRRRLVHDGGVAPR